MNKHTFNSYWLTIPTLKMSDDISQFPEECGWSRRPVRLPSDAPAFQKREQVRVEPADIAVTDYNQIEMDVQDVLRVAQAYLDAGHKRITIEVEPEDGSISWVGEFGDKVLDDMTREPEFCPDSYDRHLTEYSQRERNYKKDCIEAQTRATELFEELVMKYGQELV